MKSTDSVKDVIVQEAAFENPNDLILTIPSAAIEDVTEASEVTIPEKEVEETSDTESQILNNEVEHEITYKDVHSIDYIINSYFLVAKTTSNSLKVVSHGENSKIFPCHFFLHIDVGFML